MGSCLLYNFQLFGTRYVRCFIAMWMAFIVILRMLVCVCVGGGGGNVYAF